MVNFCSGIVELRMSENHIVLVLLVPVKYVPHRIHTCLLCVRTFCMTLYHVSSDNKCKNVIEDSVGGGVDNHGSSVWNYCRIASDRTKPTARPYVLNHYIIH